MRAPANPRQSAKHLAVLGVAALALCACSSSSHPDASSTTGAGGAAASSSSPASTGTSVNAADGCTLVTAAELSQAVGVHYTGIQDAGGGALCNVSATSVTDAFSYFVVKEGPPLHTWTQQVAGIKRDDGAESSASGVGDRAIAGAVKEFAAESNDYIVFVLDADVNTATASTFARSKTIARLLITKL